MRDVLKCRAHLLKIGVPFEYAAVVTLTIIIDHYRHKVGLPKYLSEMLGEVANEPVKDCRLYWQNGERVEIPASDQPLQRFIKRKFPVDALPFKVVVNEEVKYL